MRLLQDRRCNGTTQLFNPPESESIPKLRRSPDQKGILEVNLFRVDLFGVQPHVCSRCCVPHVFSEPLLRCVAPVSCVQPLLRCVAPESCCSQRIVRCGGWAIQPRRTGRKPRMPNDPRRPRRIGVVESPRGGCIRAGSNSEIAGAERGGGAALTADYFLTPIMRGAQGRQFDRSC